MVNRAEPNSLEWKKKVEKFKDRGVWKWFLDLRQSATIKSAIPEIGHLYAEHCVDEWLRLKDAGEPVILPEGVDPDKVGSGFIDMRRFKSVDADYRRDALWVYMNLGAETDPESAPSSGAYFWLQELRDNAEARKSFMVNIMPKLIKDDEDNPMRDDGREQFEILDRLSAEKGTVGTASPGQPVL